MPVVQGINTSLGTMSFQGKDAGTSSETKKKGCMEIKPVTKTLFVKAKHPAVDAFHEKNSFRMILKAQIRLGQEPINFLRPEKHVPEDLVASFTKK
eukprot:gnl/Chilomastix_caulleri/897.p1 GENE.gnl/Chilomastix_caulleri/897~~gnl/Chilomastix_caulleri/897.p1  ORF type:complete len:96 (+),score=27.98 gnl/Chilomastix_caulleri/897:277-564(+)